MSNTLQKVIEAGETDVEEEPTTPETEAELEIEAETDPEAVVADGEEEAEIVLGDPQEAPEDKSGLKSGVKATLAHLRRDRRELRQKTATLDTENASLRAELDQVKKAIFSKKPKYTDFATDEEYEAALLNYHAMQTQPQATPPPQQAPVPADFSDSVNAHYERAEKLGVSVQKFEAAERNVRAQLGDHLTDALIDSVGDGSEKAIMLIGSNQAQFDKVKSLLSSDPTGLKAVGLLNRLAERARVTKSRVSGAPKPTRSPSGGGGVSVSSLEKALAKAEKSNDVKQMVKARKALREARRAANPT